MKIEIDAYHNPHTRSIDLYVFSVPGRFANDAGQKPAVMQPATFIEEEDALRLNMDASLRLEEESAQRLMDSLWRCGVRPAQEEPAGQVAAMAAHLQDMRKLVFDFIAKSPFTVHAEPTDFKIDPAIFGKTFGESR